MSTDTFTRTVTIESCCVHGCGVLFGIESVYQRELRRTHKSFYCTNGHGQHYTAKSDVEMAQEAADRERRRADSLAQDLQSEKHKVAAERSAKMRLKNRITNGVCPCCNRHFANVVRHMRSKHPEVVQK